ncbi:MAG TPA: FIST N-terminal domain-containing protein [Streptosporangiaceae bacterium]
MRAAGTLVRNGDPGQAGARVAREALASLGGATPSFAVLFASSHFHRRADALLAAVTAETGRIPLIGCVGESVIGGAREIENDPAVSLLVCADAGVVESYEMQFLRTGGGGAFGGYLFEPSQGGAHLMICDPYGFPADVLLDHLNDRAPGMVVMGGMASAGSPQQQSRLFRDGTVQSGGAVGLRLADVEVHPLVSQGCRPVGDPFTVTAAQANVIYELGGRKAWARLRELAERLTGADRELLAAGVHLGIVIDEYRADQGQGDFLIRGVLGADTESEAIVVGDEVAVGQTVQFHIRDASSADADLRRVLEREAADLTGRRPAGALLFSCNGRGSRLFSEPDHDAGLVTKAFGDIPVAGFFCAGELGPVGGRNFVHAFTASIAVFAS